MVYKTYINNRQAEVERTSILQLKQHNQRHPSDSPAQKIKATQEAVTYNDLVDRVEEYFATYDGTKRVPENFRELAESVFDAERYEMRTPNGQVIPFETFYKQIEAEHLAGTEIELLGVQKVEAGFIYQLHLTNDNFDGTLQALGVVENGRLIRSEPQGENAKVYDQLFLDEETLDYNKLIADFETYFAAYDGSGQVPENLRELAEAVFDPDRYEMTTPNGQVIPFDVFYPQVEEYHRAGTKGEVVNTERTEDGFVYQIQVKTTDFDGVLEAKAIVENNRLVRSEPQGENAEVYDQIFLDEETIAYNKLVANFTDYVATYDGSGQVPDNLREMVEGIYAVDEWVLITPGGLEVDFETFYDQCEQCFLEGAKCEIVGVKKVENGFKYKLRIKRPDFRGTVEALAVVKDGKIARTEPRGPNADLYDRLFADDEPAPTVATDNLVAVGQRTHQYKSPYRPKNWNAQPRKGFYTRKDYLRDVGKTSIDKKRLHTYAVKKRWNDDELFGLTLQEKNGKIYVESVDKSTSALCLTKKSAFAYRDVDPGDQILAINGIREFESLDHAEALIRYSEEVSLVIYKNYES